MTAARSGLIFDFDSTLALTEPIWRRAEERMLQSVGRRWTPELAAQYAGMNANDLAATAHRVLGLTCPVSELQQRMRAELLAAYGALPIEPVPGAAELVRRVRGLAPIAVASGSPLPALERALGSLGLRDCVQAVLSSEAMPRGKPHPDVFLAAARTAGVSPAACVVFEDSVVGAQAARAAGMACIVRPSLESATFEGLADRVVRSWDDVSREYVAALLAARER